MQWRVPRSQVREYPTASAAAAHEQFGTRVVRVVREDQFAPGHDQLSLPHHQLLPSAGHWMAVTSPVVLALVRAWLPR